MLHIYSFIPEELAPLLCLIGFSVILFHCVFFSSCAKIHSFQFILVISFGSWICMQTYQHLVFFFFFPHFPLSHSPYSYQQFLFPCLDSGLYKGECEFRSLWMSLICRAEMVCWVKLRSLLTQQAWMYSFLRARVKVHPWWRELPSCKIFHS